MEGKRRQKGERLITTKSGRGLVFKRKAKVRNRRQKFLKVGQKSVAGEIDRKRGFHDPKS